MSHHTFKWTKEVVTERHRGGIRTTTGEIRYSLAVDERAYPLCERCHDACPGVLMGGEVNLILGNGCALCGSLNVSKVDETTSGEKVSVSLTCWVCDELRGDWRPDPSKSWWGMCPNCVQSFSEWARTDANDGTTHGPMRWAAARARSFEQSRCSKKTDS